MIIFTRGANNSHQNCICAYIYIYGLSYVIFSLLGLLRNILFLLHHLFILLPDFVCTSLTSSVHVYSKTRCIYLCKWAFDGHEHFVNLTPFKITWTALTPVLRLNSRNTSLFAKSCLYNSQPQIRCTTSLPAHHYSY